MKYSHLLAILVINVSLALALPEPVYTIHYVRSYRGDQIQDNFGCGKSVVYGTYLHPMGPVDALYALMNSHIYGFQANCQRPKTYIKIFGDDQDYSKLDDPNVGDQIGQILSRVSSKNLIIDWKYLPASNLR